MLRTYEEISAKKKPVLKCAITLACALFSAKVLKVLLT